MKLKVKCKKCKHVIRFKSKAESRLELAEEINDVISLDCPACKQSNYYHVDSVYAIRDSNKEIIIFILLFVVFAILGILIFGEIMRLSSFYTAASFIGLVAFPLAIFMIFFRANGNKIKGFNKSRLKGKRKV